MKPILFNTDMVRAILDGRKTQTRRAVKYPNGYVTGRPGWGPQGFDDAVGGYWFNVVRAQKTATADVVRSPYNPGDILYVRETWSLIRPSDSPARYVYKATDRYPFGLDGYIVKFRWHPSIHMPKEAARLFLRVKNVRVERLQEIDGLGAFDEGAVAEAPKGCFEPKKPSGYDSWDDQKKREYVSGIARAGYIARLEFADRLVKEFARIWDGTIKATDRERYGWDANPWVWVIEFERYEKPDDCCSH